MKTKKLLVAFNPQKPGSTSSDFLIVLANANTTQFVGLKSKRRFEAGMMVYIGKEIDENDLLERARKAGFNIQDARQTLAGFEKYLAALQEFRIGNVVGIALDPVHGYRLQKISESQPKINLPNLP